MNDAIGAFETSEDDLFTPAVTDEALEAAAVRERKEAALSPRPCAP